MTSWKALPCLLLALAASTPLPAGGQTPPAPAPAPPAPAPPALGPPKADAAVLATGRTVYLATCMACHQPTGLGLPSVFPPLKESEWVKAAKPGRVVRIVLHGASGPMTVNGKSFNGVMPGQAPQLTDEKIAAVITYVRHEFGGGASPVTPEYVAAARAAFKDRAGPWTQKELEAVPDK